MKKLIIFFCFIAAIILSGCNGNGASNSMGFVNHTYDFSIPTEDDFVSYAFYKFENSCTRKAGYMGKYETEFVWSYKNGEITITDKNGNLHTTAIYYPDEDYMIIFGKRFDIFL